MPYSIVQLLAEAYRRNEVTLTDSDKAKPITERWVGLGTEAAYRPAIKAGLMRFHNGKTPPPRVQGWLCLTEKGVEAMTKYEPEFKEKLDRHKSEMSSLQSYMMFGGLDV